MSLEEGKIEEYKAALTESGFKVMSGDEHSNFVTSHESLKSNALKEMKDLIDQTVYEKTGIKKNILEDGKQERTIHYYPRAYDEQNNKIKDLNSKNSLLETKNNEIQSEIEALKESNPEGAFEEKFKALKAENASLVEQYEAKLSAQDKDFQESLFLREIDSSASSLKLKKDIPYIETILEGKKQEVAKLERSIVEGKTVFHENGQPLIAESGEFMTIQQILSNKLVDLIDNTVVNEGAGLKDNKANLSLPRFNTKSEVDTYLQDKYDLKNVKQGAEKSKAMAEMSAERKQLIKANNLL